MRAPSAIGIHNNLSACKAGIAVRASNHKLACWIYVEQRHTLCKSARERAALCRLRGACKYYLAKEAPGLGRNALHHTRNKDILYVAFYALLHCHIVIKLVVLSRDYNGMHAHRFVLCRVLNGKLGFCIGTEIWHKLCLLANLGKFH